jgi:hypothetical protein
LAKFVNERSEARVAWQGTQFLGASFCDELAITARKVDSNRTSGSTSRTVTPIFCREPAGPNGSYVAGS